MIIFCLPSLSIYSLLTNLETFILAICFGIIFANFYIKSLFYASIYRYIFSASLSQEKADIESKYLSERRRWKKEKEELNNELSKVKSSEQSFK